ncbi:MAG TPA: hypothetical protein VN946_26405 [Terriglobales bacterium]|jgi:hypothetical protein|nr:hypothetical protein [Terriglobales bacterium]
MKNVFLLIVAPVLLLTLGFGQTPATTDQASISGCLSGSDGNYTVTEDGTSQTYKVTSSAVDLSPHVGHDIAVTGQKTTATSSGASNSSVVVSGVSMISEHCATATASVPAVVDTIPAVSTNTSIEADPTPVATASTPPASDTTPAATASTPAAADPMPAATASDPAQPASASATETATNAPENTEQLPNTATSLPLLGLLGLGLLGLGLLMSKKLTRGTGIN